MNNCPIKIQPFIVCVVLTTGVLTGFGQKRDYFTSLVGATLIALPAALVSSKHNK